MRNYKMVKMEQGVEKEVNEIECKYNDWLKESKLTEDDLLKFRIVPEFTIKEVKNNGSYDKFLIGYGNDEFKQIGLEFIVKKDDMESFMSLALLLLYIGNKLDNANLSAPIFEQRKGYFTNIIKLFIKNSKHIATLNLNL